MFSKFELTSKNLKEDSKFLDEYVDNIYIHWKKGGSKEMKEKLEKIENSITKDLALSLRTIGLLKYDCIQKNEEEIKKIEDQIESEIYDEIGYGFMTSYEKKEEIRTRVTSKYSHQLKNLKMKLPMDME